MSYYKLPNIKTKYEESSVYYLDYISDNFKLFYYNIGWLTLRPLTLYNIYPIQLDIVQDACYSGYTYEEPGFEGKYYGVSYTPTNTILFVYKQFNTDILFQSIYPPTPTFKTPTKSSNLILETDLTNQYIGIKLTNLDDTNLLLTTD
jgi:hypothetical protein